MKRLKRCINDVVSVVALPAMWAGSEPSPIVRTLVDVLLSVLDLDLVYALLKGANGELPIEMVRVSSVWEAAPQPQEIGAVLHKWLGDNPQEWPAVVRKPFRGRDISIVPLRLGLHYEFGLIVAGSQRTDFPQQTEGLILNVASNQAMIQLQEARSLSEEKKIAHELERQVAERTACIAAANEDLRKEIAERKEAERKLRRSEADLLEAQRLTQTCSWKHDIPSGRVSVSPEALRLFGVNSDEDISDPRCWFGKIHPEDRPRTQSLFEKCEAEKTSYEADYRVVLPDGSIKYQHSVGRPVLNGSGELIEFIGTAIDVTEQVQARSALQKAFDEIEKSEAKLRQVIDAIPTLAWCNLPDGPNEFLNKGWHEYTGLSPEESHGWGWQVAFHSEDLPSVMKKWRELLISGEPGEIEARLRRHDGVYRWFLIRVQPLRDEAGNIVRWYGTSTDIDDRKRAEEKLRESEESLRMITDAIRQAIVVLAPDGTILYANRVVRDVTGLTIREVDDKTFLKRVYHPDDLDRTLAERQEGLLRGTPFEVESRVLIKNGQYRWWLLQYNPLKDESGQIIRWYGTGTDIDDRKRTEERLRNENLVLREEIDRSSMFEEIVGSCKPMREVLKQVEKVASSDSTVLILGETGTGKELFARALHRRSKRATRAFVRVNCAAIPQSLIASELFGHEKGAFTGALQRRLGRFEAADGGTLFLDEIGELPMETQIALLRVLQEREFERVGSNHPVKVDVRLITATNRDLLAAVAAGTFRQDLFYRLNVFPIAVPPLRERAEDIPLLVEYFVGRYAGAAGKNMRHIGKETLEALRAYQWPGNIRELQNVVERAVILSEGDTFEVDESWLKREPTHPPGTHEAVSGLADRELEMIEAALAESHGRIGGPSGAAAKLGIPRQTLESKIQRLGIDKYKHKRATSK